MVTTSVGALKLSSGRRAHNWFAGSLYSFERVISAPKCLQAKHDGKYVDNCGNGGLPSDWHSTYPHEHSHPSDGEHKT